MDMLDDEQDAIIVRSTIGLAHSLGQKVVAEGIETDEQLSYLKRSGCDMGQGYLFSRPLPADQLIAFIRQHNS